jgi:DNA-directed RNA polymerase omega subunit
MKCRQLVADTDGTGGYATLYGKHGARDPGRRANMGPESRNWKILTMSDSVFGDLDGLLEHVDSKFTLVNVVTKRAKQFNNGAPPLTDRVNPNKPVSTAFNEVRAGNSVQADPRRDQIRRLICVVSSVIGAKDSVPIIIDFVASAGVSRLWLGRYRRQRCERHARPFEGRGGLGRLALSERRSARRYDRHRPHALGDARPSVRRQRHPHML